jgi:hypothetical protein
MSYFSKTLTGLARERGLGYEKLAGISDLSCTFTWRMMDSQKAASLLTIHLLAEALASVEPLPKAENPTVGYSNIAGLLLQAAFRDAVAKSKRSQK